MQCTNLLQSGLVREILRLFLTYANLFSKEASSCAMFVVWILVLLVLFEQEKVHGQSAGKDVRLHEMWCAGDRDQRGQRHSEV
jgi:hypothetical protein